MYCQNRIFQEKNMKLCSIVSNAFLKSKKEFIRHPQSIHDSLKYVELI